MPNVPIRNLGKYGIITDKSPFDLPVGAFSNGNNVRFENGACLRAPVFRSVDPSITPALVIGFYCFKDSGGVDTLFYTSKEGLTYKWVGGTEDDVSPSGFVEASNAYPVAYCQLAGVVYTNRYSEVPHKYVVGTSTDFEVLTNWDTNDKCRVLRSYKDFLVALNVTKTATQNPLLVKWSDVNVAFESEPPSWDHTDPTTSAGENILSEADSQILDGLTLRSSFVIYTESQAWLMEHVGGRFVMNTRKLFDDAGILEANCVVEVEGKHFVFGRQDIYAHDLVTKMSIADDKVKRRVFTTLKTTSAQHCFAQHDPRRHEIIFGYVSNESDIKWPNTEFCNRAAVYNYTDGVWSFRDLPNVVKGDFAKVNTTLAWSAATFSWDSFGSTWGSQSDGGERQVVMPSSGQSVFITEVDGDLITEVDGDFIVLPYQGTLSNSRILGLDGGTLNALMSFAIEDELVTDWFVERRGWDLDELGEKIRGYKICNAIFPQMEIYDDSEITVSIAGEVTSGVPLDTYDESMSFEPTGEDRVDFRQGGRYLAVKFSGTGSFDFSLTGMDFQYYTPSKR